MQPYQERVVAEKAELDDKIAKLDTFIHGETYKQLPEDEAARLYQQALYMGDYSRILGERIAAFKE